MQMVYNPKSVKSRWGASVSHKKWDTDAKGYKPDKHEVFVATVDCFPLQSILLAANLTIIDFFSLDLEGVELKVLRTVDWKKITVNVSDNSRSRVYKEVVVDQCSTNSTLTSLDLTGDVLGSSTHWRRSSRYCEIPGKPRISALLRKRRACDLHQQKFLTMMMWFLQNTPILWPSRFRSLKKHDEKFSVEKFEKKEFFSFTYICWLISACNYKSNISTCLSCYIHCTILGTPLVLRPAGSDITFWLAITCCQQSPLEASNVLAYLLRQEQLIFQAVENTLILQKFLVGVASLCHKEIGVQTGSSNYMLSHSFPVTCKSMPSWKRYCLRLLKYIINWKLWNVLKLFLRFWIFWLVMKQNSCRWLFQGPPLLSITTSQSRLGDLPAPVFKFHDFWVSKVWSREIFHKKISVENDQNMVSFA